MSQETKQTLIVAAAIAVTLIGLATSVSTCNVLTNIEDEKSRREHEKTMIKCMEKAEDPRDCKEILR